MLKHVSLFASQTMFVFPAAIQFRVFRSWTAGCPVGVKGDYDPTYILIFSVLWFHLKFDWKGG
jgi:hypothetical protein